MRRFAGSCAIRREYVPTSTIAVDVDGTLQIDGQPNSKVIEWCRQKKSEGSTLILWSAAGASHARSFAESFGVAELFSAIISKPSLILDDQGWDWIRYTATIRTLE